MLNFDSGLKIILEKVFLCKETRCDYSFKRFQRNWTKKLQIQNYWQKCQLPSFYYIWVGRNFGL